MGNVNRWFVTLVNQPQFKKVVGEFKLCTTMAKFDAKKFGELHPKDDKKAKKQQEQKPQIEKKEEAPAKPKAKDPYADLPKSSFDLDEFKRTYSNNKDTLGVVMPYFWEKFDKEGYSLWKAEYIEESPKMTFMASNLVSGMFQRLEKLSKTAFASVCILGDDGDVSISGVWIMRGQELAFRLNEDWNIDAPSYKFEKLDPDSTETRALVGKYFAQDGDFGGKEVADAKNLK